MSNKKPSETTPNEGRAGADGVPQSDGLNRRGLLRMAAASAGLAAVGGTVLTACGGGEDATTVDGRKEPLAGGPKPPITTPTITCAPNGTDGKHVIDVTVCAPAGGTGLPAGFSVQWMTCDAFNNGTTVTDPVTFVTTTINLPGQWPADSDAAAAAGVLCKSSFSGNANQTKYNLAAGACLTVYAGSFSIEADPNNPDNNPSLGYSTSCPGPLECDTCYVFRAFGHATSKLIRSAFSLNCESTTNACNVVVNHFTGCTKTQGYFGSNAKPDGSPPANGAWDAVGCAITALRGSAVIGGASRSATFTTVAAIAAYLPGGGSSGALVPSPTTNPTNTTASGGGTLAAQALTLTLNIAVSGNCANNCAAGNYPAGFGDAYICGVTIATALTDSSTFSATFAAWVNGKQVKDVLAEANNILNGTATAGLSASELNDLCTRLNESFDGTPCCGATYFGSGHLFVGGCPA